MGDHDESGSGPALLHHPTTMPLRRRRLLPPQPLTTRSETCLCAHGERISAKVYTKDKEATMIIAFWLRTNIPDMTMPYRHLDDLVVRYYFNMKFEWDVIIRIKPLELSDLHTVAKLTRSHFSVCCRSIYAESVLSGKTLSTAQWEP